MRMKKRRVQRKQRRRREREIRKSKFSRQNKRKKQTRNGGSRPLAATRPTDVTDRAFGALRAIRHGMSASRAARENGISLRTLKQYVGRALVQDHPGGRFRARRNDGLLRYLQIPGPHGPVEIEVRGSKAASETASYKADVNRALAGDPKALDKWHGKKIASVDLITDVRVLADQADKGLLPYALYRSFSGGRG